MRGIKDQAQAMFCYISQESFVPKDHPLRPSKRWSTAHLRKFLLCLTTSIPNRSALHSAGKVTQNVPVTGLLHHP